MSLQVGGWGIALEVAQCVLLVGLQVGGWGIALDSGTMCSPGRFAGGWVGHLSSPASEGIDLFLAG